MTNFNKVALVTGGSKGIGKAIALEFSRKGYRVCIVARDEKKLSETSKEISSETKHPVEIYTGDVSRESSAQEVMAYIHEKFNRLDILVNNAGGPPPGSFLDKSEQDWDLALQQNLLSVVRFSKAAIPIMRKNDFGRIINISSSIAKEPTPMMVLSASARAAVSAFSKSISGEIAPWGITINTICPGGVFTDRLKSLVRQASEKASISFEDQLSKNLELIPMNRFADPVEIAHAACFYASNESGYITGTNLMVDGALTKSFF